MKKLRQFFTLIAFCVLISSAAKAEFTDNSKTPSHQRYEYGTLADVPENEWRTPGSGAQYQQDFESFNRFELFSRRQLPLFLIYLFF